MKKEVKIFLTFFVFYSIFINWYGWNEQSHFVLTRAIADENRFEIDSFYNLTGDRSVFNNHYYSDKDPGLAIISQPIYNLWKVVFSFLPSDIKQANKFNPNAFYIDVSGKEKIYWYYELGFFINYSMILLTIFSSCLFSSLTTVLVYKISSIFIGNERMKILLTLVYGLGTLQFIYSLHFMSHAVATFFSFLSFFIFFTHSDKRKIFLSGIFSGFAIVVDHSLLLLVSLFLLYCFFKKREFFFILLFSSFLGILPLLIYNFVNFGDPLTLASTYVDRNIFTKAYELSGVSNTKIEVTKLSIVDIESVLKKLHFEFQPNAFIFLRLLIYPYRGFFFYHPIFLLIIPGMIFMRKKYKLETLFFLSLLIFFPTFVSMRRIWWGGYCFGERYFVPITPFLFIPVIYSTKRIDKKIFFILAIISIFVNIVGLGFAEDYAYDWKSMDMKSDWFEKQNSLTVLYNPLFEHYIPQFLNYGPRSRILEEVINGYVFSIDIRLTKLPCGFKCNKPYRYIPFIPLIFFSIPIFFLRKELKIG